MYISKDYSVDFCYCLKEVFVVIDVNLFFWILWNLLINVMKYGVNGKVLLVVWKVNENLEISIYD